jgi:hypothetical protein
MRVCLSLSLFICCHLKITALILLKSEIDLITSETTTIMYFQLPRIGNNSMAKAGTCEVWERVVSYTTHASLAEEWRCVRSISGIIPTGKNRSTTIETCNITRFTTTYIKRAERKSNPALFEKSPATNGLSHGIWFLVVTACSLVHGPKHFGESCCRLHFQKLPWRWR